MSINNNPGVTNAGVFTLDAAGGLPAAGFALDAEAVASGGAFLASELEKRDMTIRKPLTSVTYPRDIPIKTGGGWVDYASAMAVAYGITGGSGEGAIHAGGANAIPVVQANLDKGLFKAHVFATTLRVMFVDMQRAAHIGRSLDQLLQDGIRLTYDKHMDENVYRGFTGYGTTGLLNNPDVAETTVSTGASGDTAWKSKTPAEILVDINEAITAVWAASDYDEDAVPNHILLPYEQLLYLHNTMISDLGEKSIMKYIEENNFAAKKGTPLYFGATKWAKGAGTGGTDRMTVYCNNERFLCTEEFVPLSRVMTAPNVANVCYDTAYMANLSEVEIMYGQTIGYFDGI